MVPLQVYRVTVRDPDDDAISRIRFYFLSYNLTDEDFDETMNALPFYIQNDTGCLFILEHYFVYIRCNTNCFSSILLN